jgi:hypothetical protein
MIPYQFADGVTVDLENLVAVDGMGFINASINAHSDYNYGEHCYELVFRHASKKIRRYAHYDDEAELTAERNQLIEDWKTGTSRCLVPPEGEKKRTRFYPPE